MSSLATTGLVTDMGGLRRSAGESVGYTDWAEITQEQVSQFAELTGDHNFLHVDPERAKATPFGGTIAHGFLSLSLVAPVTQRLQVTDAATSVNYGLDKVRFPAPLPVGGQWRGTAEIAEVTDVKGGLQAKLTATVEVKGSERPAVVVNDVDSAAAAETVRLIAAGGGRAVAQIAAIGDGEAAQALVDRAVSEFGRLDVTITNAGVLRDRVLWKMTDEAFDLVIRTHLRGTFTCARAAAIQMRGHTEGGRIIVVGSPAGQFGNFGQTNYAAAKAGIVAFARTWSLELARDGITVNAIVPTA